MRWQRSLGNNFFKKIKEGNTLRISKKLWRPEIKLGTRGAKWRTWEALDDKRWIVLVPKVGGTEGELEEWDLVEEFFQRIQDPVDDDEEEEETEEEEEEEEGNRDVEELWGVVLFPFVLSF